jgi:hypothetical protein
MKRLPAVLLICLFLSPISRAIEGGLYRLLSVSEAGKLILVSQIPDKTKYVLDASAAKITIDGKAAEFKTLQTYAVVQVKFDLRKSTKEGIEIDGSATEIKISTPKLGK